MPARFTPITIAQFRGLSGEQNLAYVEWAIDVIQNDPHAAMFKAEPLRRVPDPVAQKRANFGKLRKK
jgi:hypothetical protein